MAFPTQRMRRLRTSETLRRMVRETRLSVDDLVYPMFVREGHGVRREIASMPGQFQLSVDVLVEACGEIESLGIPAVILFGIPDEKDATGSGAWADDGIVQRAVTAIKQQPLGGSLRLCFSCDRRDYLSRPGKPCRCRQRCRRRS